ncbi:MAG: hypothetical protein DYG90_08870 [Chloroflexi bacterium CFX6]|nr:hypothetical protein [Chloroflexi bacterium CFX6]
MGADRLRRTITEQQELIDAYRQSLAAARSVIAWQRALLAACHGGPRTPTPAQTAEPPQPGLPAHRAD